MFRGRSGIQQRSLLPVVSFQAVNVDEQATTSLLGFSLALDPVFIGPGDGSNDHEFIRASGRVPLASPVYSCARLRCVLISQPLMTRGASPIFARVCEGGRPLGRFGSSLPGAFGVAVRCGLRCRGVPKAILLASSCASALVRTHSADAAARLHVQPCSSHVRTATRTPSQCSRTVRTRCYVLFFSTEHSAGPVMPRILID